jgi:hypothetical protein
VYTDARIGIEAQSPSPTPITPVLRATTSIDGGRASNTAQPAASVVSPAVATTSGTPSRPVATASGVSATAARNHQQTIGGNGTGSGTQVFHQYQNSVPLPLSTSASRASSSRGMVVGQSHTQAQGAAVGAHAFAGSTWSWHHYGGDGHQSGITAAGSPRVYYGGGMAPVASNSSYNRNASAPFYNQNFGGSRPVAVATPWHPVAAAPSSAASVAAAQPRTRQPTFSSRPGVQGLQAAGGPNVLYHRFGGSPVFGGASNPRYAGSSAASSRGYLSAPLAAASSYGAPQNRNWGGPGNGVAHGGNYPSQVQRALPGLGSSRLGRPGSSNYSATRPSVNAPMKQFRRR